MNIKNSIKALLAKFNIRISKIPKNGAIYLIQSTDHGPFRLWDEDPVFNQLYDKIKDNTLINKIKCYTLYQFAIYAKQFDAGIVEVGVYLGGSARLLASILNNKNIYIFDTFEGMPEPDAELDTHIKGNFNNATFDIVSNFLGDLKNIKIFKGIFPETASSIVNKRFSLAHIDVDIYKSTYDCCEFFYPRMISGGVILFDDYGFGWKRSAKKSIDKFFESKSDAIVYLPTGQAIVIKK